MTIQNFTLPTVPETPFPINPTETLPASNVMGSSVTENFSSLEVPDQEFLTPVIAQQLISHSLDTLSQTILKPFTFQTQGAIQIGTYVNGVSGDLSLSPNGIAARNSSGDTTFAIDGTTGNATFKGTIVAGSVISASIAAANITGQIVNAQILSVDYAKITSVAVTNAQIVNLDAGKITTGTLSANFISGGTLVMGGGSNANGVISVLNGSGVEISRMNNSGIIVRNTRGLFWEETTGGNYQSISCNASNQFIIALPTANQFFIVDNAGSTNLFTVSTNQIYSEKPLVAKNTIVLGSSASSHDAQIFTSSGSLEINPDNGNIDLNPSSGKVVNITGNGLSMHADIGMNGSSISGIAQIHGNGQLNFQVSGSNKFSFRDSSNNEQLNIEPNGGGTTRINMNGHSLTLSSDKTAIVPTQDGYRALYCIEAPDVWFMDFVDNRDNKVDPIFDQVTEGKRYFIKAQDEEGNVVWQVWRRRKGHAQKRFERKTQAEFEKNEQFLRMAKL